MASLQGSTLKVRVPLDNTTMHTTVYVKLTREYRVRLWLGTKLLIFAAWVLGCHIHIRAETEL